MRFSDDLQKILKPISLGLTLYVIGSLIFIGLYVYIDYQKYLSSFQITQQAELKIAQSKLSLNIENLKKLSILTSRRIASSYNDVKQLQNILNSSYSLLPSADYFKIERIAYNKLSKPQSRITRFGPLPLKSEHTPSETPHQKGPVVVFQEDSIISKTWIFNAGGTLEGFLEISLDPSAFKTTLPMGTALFYMPLKTSILLQQEPFPIYGKLPLLFWEYTIKYRAHYTIFFAFMLFSLIAMGSHSYGYWWRLKKVYKEKLQTLKNALSRTQTELEKNKTILFSHQQQMRNYQASFQSFKKFQISFRHHQKEQIGHLLRFLDAVLNFYKRPNTELPPENQIEIIESCIKTVECLCDGTPSKIRNESVQVLKILDNIQDLFTEKIHKSHVDVEVNCSENLLYYGDAFFMEFVLINLIGKSLYSIPPNGKVTIKTTNQKEELQVQIRDNGFCFDKKIHNQLKQSFDFFMSSEIFRKVCQANNLRSEQYRTKNGLNVAKIFFPKADEKSLGENVISFSRKR